MTIPYSNLIRTFGRIGCLSFGGPAAQIALMEDEIVAKRGWLTQDSFLRALSFCMLLPGPEAMQLATYTGWRLRGIPGGILAGTLFVLPGSVVIFALAALYIAFGTQPLVYAAFVGVQATVIVIVLQALVRLSKKGLTDATAYGLALFAFLGLFAFSLPFPLILLIAAVIGASRPQDPKAADPETVTPTAPTTLAIWLCLWIVPIGALLIIDAPFLSALSLFFAKLAVVTFGGAYAVLAYMTQQVVTEQGWIETQVMIDALGLAETTPGPLILVTQFVGTLAGYGQGGWALALGAALLTLWVTFVPCFLWIFAGAPYLERMTGHPRIAAALKAITAAVVGVILNLSLWFAMHVFFASVTQYGGMSVPEFGTLRPAPVLLCALAAVLLIRQNYGLPVVLLICGLTSVGLELGMGLI